MKRLTCIRYRKIAGDNGSNTYLSREGHNRTYTPDIIAEEIKNQIDAMMSNNGELEIVVSFREILKGEI